MTTIYIVWASQGEYSDRREWAVAGYTTEALAQAYCTEISAAAREAFEKWERYKDAPGSAYYEDVEKSDGAEAEIFSALVALGDDSEHYFSDPPTYTCGPLEIRA